MSKLPGTSPLSSSFALRQLQAARAPPRPTLLPGSVRPSCRWGSVRSHRASFRPPSLRSDRSAGGLSTAVHHPDSPVLRTVVSMSAAEIETRSFLARGRATYVGARGRFARVVGLTGEANLRRIDALAVALLIGLLCSMLPHRANEGLMALVALWVTSDAVQTLGNELQAHVRGGDAAPPRSWREQMAAHFAGGGADALAARLLWWAFFIKLASIVVTAILEPMCLQQPCITHASACPLPYRLNHRSVGYTLDFFSVALMLFGALVLVVLDREKRLGEDGAAGVVLGRLASSMSGRPGAARRSWRADDTDLDVE